MTIEGVSDKDDFTNLRESMKVLGLERTIQTEIYSLLASILHLGNINFHSEKGDAAIVTDKAELSVVAR